MELNSNKQEITFSKDEGINYQLNRWYRAAGSDSYKDLKEIGSSVSSIEEYIDKFLELAEVREKEGEIKRAAYYYRAAEFYILSDDPRKHTARKKYLKLLKQVFDIKDEQRFEVPYENTYIPAYKFYVDDPKGTIVVFGGYDSYIEELTSNFKYFNEAGYNVIAFEGPGQGTSLEDNNLKLTCEWEKPTKCILDYFNLDDVVLIGMSLGGGLSIRAAAYEKRVKYVVSFDVLYSFYECFASDCDPKTRDGLDALIDGGQKEKLNYIMKNSMARKPLAAWAINQGMHVTGTDNPYDYLVVMKKFTTENISSLVDQDVLLMAGTKDNYVPLDMLYKQMKVLTNAKSITSRIFTEAENAQDHCQTSNVKLALDVIIDWVNNVMKR